MDKKEYIYGFVKEFLPYEAELLFFREPYKGPAILIEDIDGDDVREVIAAYRWQDENYITLIKKKEKGWVTLDNHNIKCQDVTFLETGCSIARGNSSIKISYNRRDGSSLYETFEWTGNGFRLIETFNIASLLGKTKPISLHTAPEKTVKGTKYGYINNKGKYVIQTKFEYANPFQSNGLAVIKLNDKYGIIDITGKYVVHPIYESIGEFSEGRAVVMQNGKYKVIDEAGNVLTTKMYSFIGDYKNGRALFGEDTASDGYSYGYLDLQGREVVPAKFQSAGDFNGGKAIVKLKENQFGLINLNGRILKTYNYAEVGNLSEGLLSFRPTSGNKFGYIDDFGKVIIKPQFSYAQPFKYGRAVVNITEDYTNKYGLIDRSGNFIIKPQYNSIDILGENRVSVGKAIDEQKPFIGSKYALADTVGSFITDYIYNSILDYSYGKASATDNKNTFFINKSGKIIRHLPIVNGKGILSTEGNLIKAFVDNRTSYYNRFSKLVWRQNNIIPLNKIYRVIEEKYKPNKDYLVYYPQVEGMKNKEIQKNVNVKLRELSLIKSVSPEAQLEGSHNGDFSVEFFRKELLVLEFEAYDYTFGAAHGMPSKVYPHIDLITGRFYELKDLFKNESNYVKVLSHIIGEQIKTDPQYSYVFPNAYKGIKANQPFYVDENNLYIYFAPYEIAPYAAGFPTFKIPFSDIMDIIDTKKEFWKSFN